jgi:hypothetical protein
MVTPSQAGVRGPFRPRVPGGRKRQTALRMPGVGLQVLWRIVLRPGRPKTEENRGGRVVAAGGGLEKAALFAGGNSQGPGAELPRNGPHRQYVVGSAPFHSIGLLGPLKGASRPHCESSAVPAAMSAHAPIYDLTPVRSVRARGGLLPFLICPLRDTDDLKTVIHCPKP